MTESTPGYIRCLFRGAGALADSGSGDLTEVKISVLDYSSIYWLRSANRLPPGPARGAGGDI